ncbi:MAG TPA: phasin family protein [Syntrophales bacterium]|nr:phasin family protein [Syntrophales bacterium]
MHILSSPAGDETNPGGKTMYNLIKKSILMGAGLCLVTADKLNEIVDELVQKGEMTKEEAKASLDKLLGKAEKGGETLKAKQEKILTELTAFWYYGVVMDELEERIEKIVEAALEGLNIPTQTEIMEIRSRIEALERKRSQG